MNMGVAVDRACPTSSSKGGDAANNPKSGIRRLAVPHRLIVRTTFFSSKFCMVLIFATTHLVMISAQFIFKVPSTSYNCSSNLICLGQAHEYTEDGSNGIQVGRLSLLNELWNKSLNNRGVAYYREPVKLLDLANRQPASFNTSFTIDMRYGVHNGSSYYGDGMAFVIRADNKTIGDAGASFGIYHGQSLSTSSKTIVVEFDTFMNDYYPEYDISDDHVSLDFKNITWKAAANCSDVNISMRSLYQTYAWVEYSKDTQKLEVRISYGQSRPISPLLNYTVNLFDFLEEYMWVGFSSSAGNAYSNYYIGDWTFESSLGSIGSPTPSPVPTKVKSGKSNLGLITGVSLSGVFLLACIAALVYVLMSSGGRRRLRYWQLRLGFKQEDGMFPIIEGMPERFSYSQLSVATNQFNEESKLGQGGFGSVYRGVLPSSGIPVAVKRINSDSAQGEKQFMAEISIISQLRHRNLINLLGWCKDMTREKYLLVYELMPNGSLDKVLFPGPGQAQREQSCLSWQQRLNIVTGTAAAVDYLHQGWKQQVIHRDIKSSNIMLDGEWNAVLADFGLARLVDHERDATTTGVAGTYGFISPEAAATGHFTDKSDVFAFGALVLEIACGRRAFLPYVQPEEMALVDWVWRSLSEGDLFSTVDKRLEIYDTYWMEVVFILGLLCSHPDPLARPSMRHVLKVLAGDVPVPTIPASKPVLFSLEPPNSVPIDDPLILKRRSTSKSRSGSISLVSAKISDASQEHTGKSHGSSSKSKTSF